MLLKKNRLKKNKNFEKVFQKGKRFQKNFLFLKVVKNDLEISRFGFIVSQKISKKAVIRNRLKRRLREGLRHYLPEIKQGVDGVFISRPGLEKEDFEELKKTIKGILSKAELLKAKRQKIQND